MSFQIIRKKTAGNSLEATFAHADCLNFSGAPVTIGGSGCDCVLEGFQGTIAVISGNFPEYTLTPERSGIIRISGEYVNSPCCLSSGSMLEAGGYSMNFHLQFAKANVSNVMQKIGKLSKQLVIVCIVLEILLMSIAPFVMKNDSYWHGQTKRMLLVKRIDAAVRQISKTKTEDPFKLAILHEINSELGNYKEYLRENLGSLSLSQRNKIENDLEYWQQTIEWLENNEALPQAATIDLNKVIDKVIKNYQIEQ